MKKIIKLRTEINEMKKLKCSKKPRAVSLGIKKYESLARLTKKGGKNHSKLKQKRKGDVTTDITEIQKIIKDFFKNLYAIKQENLE